MEGGAAKQVAGEAIKRATADAGGSHESFKRYQGGAVEGDPHPHGTREHAAALAAKAAHAHPQDAAKPVHEVAPPTAAHAVSGHTVGPFVVPTGTGHAAALDGKTGALLTERKPHLRS